MATVDPEPFQFVIAGIISAWSPVTRLLQIGGHELWVARDVSVTNVATGHRSTAVGHVEPTGRRVVTRLTVD